MISLAVKTTHQIRNDPLPIGRASQALSKSCRDDPSRPDWVSVPWSPSLGGRRVHFGTTCYPSVGLQCTPTTRYSVSPRTFGAYVILKVQLPLRAQLHQRSRRPRRCRFCFDKRAGINGDTRGGAGGAHQELFISQIGSLVGPLYAELHLHSSRTEPTRTFATLYV